ncbi:hypothetical protein WSK_2473 [Novosphingobium sp. Rr 2-17]|uniref:hypothetical protein n=1 Tax=Novosphingobium sp. Rr 2-17 TaxID=555793 RepID=UPI000269AB5F|nr:hypothetical protein [Novosphingobium sp. Rr 2-17]EIZ78930.1 hypothetical protein WSK_2473 [Novosphingobium sp. Rr 2-17]
MEWRKILGELRQDDSDWRRGQYELTRAFRVWRADPPVARVLAAFKRFGKGAALDQSAALAALFAPHSSEAGCFVASLMAAGVAALDGYPLGQVPIPHGSRDAVPTLILASAGNATLALTVYDGPALAALPPPRTVRFQPVESWMRVVAGEACGEHIIRRDRSDGGTVIHSSRISLAQGDVQYRYGPREALHVRRVNGSLAVLRLERRLGDAGPVCEHSLPDGALLRQASASRDDSRSELAVALLGAMERHDAMPVMARIALNQEGTAGDAVRWQALRETTALDVQAGMKLLSRIASTVDDSLSAQAMSLYATLEAGQTWPG